MNFLLTSTGDLNDSIQSALVDLLGKPISESTALAIPSGLNPFPGGFGFIQRFVTGSLWNLGWKSIGLMELTVLPTIERSHWVSAVEETDVLLVYGGDVTYLTRWMQLSGLAELLPTLSDDKVYLGVSAGSIITAPVYGETYNNPDQPFVIQDGLGLVDFALLPHLDHVDHPESTTEKFRNMAAEVPVPVYGIDDATAIKVRNGVVEVVSEGIWELVDH